MSFGEAVQFLQRSACFDELSEDQPVGDVYEHPKADDIWCVPFLHDGRKYAMFFQYFADFVQDLVYQETGVKVGPVIFGVKFCRADNADVMDKDQIFEPKENRKEGSLGHRAIIRFPEKLLLAASKHFELFEVHCYVMAASDEKLNALYARMARHPMVEQANMISLCPKSDVGREYDDGWYAFVPKHTVM